MSPRTRRGGRKTWAGSNGPDLEEKEDEYGIRAPLHLPPRDSGEDHVGRYALNTKKDKLYSRGHKRYTMRETGKPKSKWGIKKGTRYCRYQVLCVATEKYSYSSALSSNKARYHLLRPPVSTTMGEIRTP